MKQILYRKHVQLLVVAKHTNDIPTKAIHIYPTSLSPLWTRGRQKLRQRIVVQFSQFDLVFAKVYGGYTASLDPW